MIKSILSETVNSFPQNFAKVFALQLDLFEHFLECVDQSKMPTSDLSSVPDLRRQVFRYTNDYPSCKQFPVMQLKGSILELLVLDQLSDQIPARILFLCIFIRRLLMDRRRLRLLM